MKEPKEKAQEILNEMLQLGVLIDYITIDLNAMLSRGLNSKINMTKYLAKYFKGSNIRFNCISPGGIRDNQPKSFIKK